MIDGAVSDKQRGYQPKTEVADFFLKRFLGCQLLEAADITTKQFFNAAEEFINGHISDPARKARYNIALLAEMNNSSAVVRPRDFAQQHLELDDRQPFIAHLETNNLPIAVIEKDKTLVASQIQRLQVEFSSRLSVLGSPQAFQEHVKISQMEDGRTRLVIEDQLNQVHGKR